MEVFLPIAQVFVNPIEILLLSAIVGILSGLVLSNYFCSVIKSLGIMNKIEAEPGSFAPKVTFEIGEMVRVIEGPFNDFSGVIEEVNYEKSRVKLAVLIFGRSTPVELEFTQIEKG